MSKELPYFRFHVQEWQNGDISLENFDLQGLFISICGYYWIKDCSITLAVLEKRYNYAKADIKSLIELNILKHNSDTDIIDILFLNEQFDLLSNNRKAKQKAGSEGGKKKASNAKALLKQKSSYKDKDKDKDNIPKITEFLEHGKQLCKKASLPFVNYKFSIEAKYQAWVGDGWKDGHGSKIKNWKTKLMNVLPHLKEIKPQGYRGIPNAIV